MGGGSLSISMVLISGRLQLWRMQYNLIVLCMLAIKDGISMVLLKDGAPFAEGWWVGISEHFYGARLQLWRMHRVLKCRKKPWWAVQVRSWLQDTPHASWHYCLLELVGAWPCGGGSSSSAACDTAWCNDVSHAGEAGPSLCFHPVGTFCSSQRSKDIACNDQLLAFLHSRSQPSWLPWVVNAGIQAGMMDKWLSHNVHPPPPSLFYIDHITCGVSLWNEAIIIIMYNIIHAVHGASEWRMFSGRPFWHLSSSRRFNFMGMVLRRMYVLCEL